MNLVKQKRNDQSIIVPTTAISLTPADIPFIVNGPLGCPQEFSPFQACFTSDKNRKAWENIGFVPFTKSSLKNKQVRREINETNPQDTKLENLQLEYECAKSDLARDGFNYEVLSEEIPKATKIRRKETEKEQMEELLKNKKTFSASGIFMHTKNMVFNSETLLKAERITLAQMKDKKQAACEKAASGELKVTAEALAACEFYKNNPISKVLAPHWKAICRFILTETKDEACISHFKKVQDVKDKLEEMGWKGYMEKVEGPGEAGAVDQEVITIDENEGENQEQTSIPEELRTDDYDGEE